ncbi:MAG: zf-HC2 domain-containing protein [Planctomycetes bacterium]|nr:zf-HC2 domain-containing protein [Planctomycetota bacterium]
MSRCRQAAALRDYVDRELSLEGSLQFEAHLEECASCRAALAAERALDEALTALPRPRLDEAARQRLRAAVAARVAETTAVPRDTSSGPSSDTPSPLRFWRAPRWRRFALPLAMAAAASVLAWIAWRPEPPRSADRPAPAVPTVATHDAPAAPPPAAPSSFAVAPAAATLAGPRDELATIVRQLARGHAAAEGGDLLTTFLVAAEPLRARGLALPALLQPLLHDDDASLAAMGAALVAAAVRDGALRRDEPGLVASLERALRRPDRAHAALRALEAIATRRAFEAIAGATGLPALREPALMALAAAGRREAQPALERELTALLHGRAGDVALAERIAARLAVPNVEALRTLAALQRAGLAPTAVTERLTAAAATALPLLVAALRSDDAALRQDALALATLARDGSLADALAAAAARHAADAPAAFAALDAIGAAPALLALAQWRATATPTPTRPLARLAEERFAALAAALPPEQLAGAVGDVARAEPQVALAFAEFALTVEGPGGTPLRAALLDHALASGELRARAALQLARGREPFATERAHALLQEIAPTLIDDPGADGGLAAALLVLLYAQGAERELARGLVALGWPTTPARVARLAGAAQRVLDERSLERSVERLDRLLALGP